MNDLTYELQFILDDARRYRWLRDAKRVVPNDDPSTKGAIDYIMVGNGNGSSSSAFGDFLDFCIDEAMDEDLLRRYKEDHKKTKPQTDEELKSK